MTVTPAMCASFMRIPAPKTGASSPAYGGLIYRIYRWILDRGVDRQIPALGGLEVRGLTRAMPTNVKAMALQI